MDERTKELFHQLENGSKEEQYEAYQTLLEEMETEVPWAYEVWDKLVDWLTDKDAHRRSRGAQFLSFLAISDPENRILRDFPKVWQVTKDEKFVTARHSLQAIWRVALGGEKQKNLVTGYLIERFYTAEEEKNGTLLREDILKGLRALYERDEDPYIEEQAKGLIDSVDDEKYAKKYMKIWK
ncbi:hypothetical protein [Salimicrobium halophilum]|uniref:HEAT repeat-containing protein n=1 Tax=Salimicrobium halophilum TaxID=86666 RepID=A0A1G8T6E5_9BACI|nr:hypothetical protein [Salimicrobium halophilum]SDJ37199.1 hypothetical protein SAMN04490247_1736 [Salimicrobium halophilum]